MPDAYFEHQPDNPVELFPGQVLDVQVQVGFDIHTAVTHFRYKMHALQFATEALYHFKVEFYNTEAEATGDWDPILIQDGWIGDAGDSWGFDIDNQTTFVSDHEYYGSEESDWSPPYHVATYTADGGGSSWVDNILADANKDTRYPGGGDWFLRFTVDEDSPGNVMLYAFSFEFAYTGFRGRNIHAVPVTEGWWNQTETPSSDLYVIIHRGMAYLYGTMLDWYNYNEEADEDWFTEVYDDATTMIVAPGGLPEVARPAGRVVVPIRLYDFERAGAAIGMTWHLSINPNGSITILPREGRPDKLRLGGGEYSFAPMQVRWPIADPPDNPDTDDGSGGSLTWEVHNELINNGEAGGGQVWEVDQDIRLAAHGGVTHLQAAVHHNSDTTMDVPLWHSGGVLDSEGGRSFDGVKVIDDSPGPGQDFGFIQQFTLELSDIPGGGTVQFDASRSTGQMPLDYAWNFGDGSTGSGKTPSHTYDDPGTYWVKLTVTDPRDRSDSVTKRPKAADPPEGYGGESNDWASYVNDNGAVINSPGEHTLFLSADPLTQVFKGADPSSGSIPNAPGTHLVGEPGGIDAYFEANKELLYSGIRQANVDQISPQMPDLTASVVGRKFGTAVCIQPDGSHYRHEVECLTAGPLGTNSYRHKLIKCVGGVDTVLSTVTNNSSNCDILAQITYGDIEKIAWRSGFSFVSFTDTSIPKSGTWGIFFTSGITQGRVSVTGNSFPSYPPAGEIVKIDAWWPSEYVYDESTPDA